MIAGVVALGLFGLVVAAALLVDLSVRRARRQAEAWAAFDRRLAVAARALSVGVVGMGVSFAQAARAAEDFARALRGMEATLETSSSAVDRLRADVEAAS